MMSNLGIRAGCLQAVSWLHEFRGSGKRDRTLVKDQKVQVLRAFHTVAIRCRTGYPSYF